MRKGKEKNVICGILALLIIVICWSGYLAISKSDRVKSELEPGKGAALEDEQSVEIEETVEEKGPGGKGERRWPGELTIQYLGHSCFFLDVDGFRILIDPFSPQVGYGTLQKEADLVTISHEHTDHNFAKAAPGAKVIRGLTPDGLGWETVSYTEGNISITSIPTYHDEASGRLRGRNAVFIFDISGIRIVHLGDLGHLLPEGDVERISPVDILLVPVGGHYTIDALEAAQVVEQLVPSVVIPMHYRTRATRNLPISSYDPFLEGENTVQKKGNKPLKITKNILPETTEIWILDPADITIEQNE